MSSGENNLQSISIEILSKDRIGLMSEITSVISELDAQIIHYGAKVFTDRRSRKMSECNISMSITEQNCPVLLSRLRKISGVVALSALRQMPGVAIICQND